MADEEWQLCLIKGLTPQSAECPYQSVEQSELQGEPGTSQYRACLLALVTRGYVCCLIHALSVMANGVAGDGLQQVGELVYMKQALC